MGPTEKIILEKLQAHLEPIFLHLQNESENHSRPASAESHFRVIVVSKRFESLSRVQRQQKVYSILEFEMKNHIHALSQFAFTPEEWNLKKHEFDIQSPECQHKS
jgi:stress-induced morphogen